jgi:hypothetical protein
MAAATTTTKNDPVIILHTVNLMITGFWDNIFFGCRKWNPLAPIFRAYMEQTCT